MVEIYSLSRFVTTVARGLASSAPLPLSTLLSLPLNLLLIRQQAFQLHAELIWTADEYAQFWPFVDNI